MTLAAKRQTRQSLLLIRQLSIPAGAENWDGFHRKSPDEACKLAGYPRASVAQNLAA